ncbi:hypothetical protein [Burkholderia sp. Bp8984]|uniref:hypothetical protein n=1 Tax=Burkholderia sp. Bp8984 TaxID=2184549 RepID=UPI000F5967D4|nr:hypothetical protein [Burkholderia sp. Bp8984]RQS59260.1 hypothetical protein DID98_16640 [Burkholderia sp. Bp8984]
MSLPVSRRVNSASPGAIRAIVEPAGRATTLGELLPTRNAFYFVGPGFAAGDPRLNPLFVGIG